jgi:1,4-alpha-glucan branching enzyme
MTVDAHSPASLWSEQDVDLFKKGAHFRLHEKLGAHPLPGGERTGTIFAVWAPNAERVSVIGDFNDWDRDHDVLRRRDDDSGIWEGFVSGSGPGDRYKYHVVSRYRDYRADKGDPFARRWEPSPGTAGIVWEPEYAWGDAEWRRERGRRNALDAPWSVYEVHLGSWRRSPEDGGRFLTYRELARELPDYLEDMGYTHVEFLPVMEHPFYGSWGYQTTGYFAPTSRYGPPEDLMFLVDALHQRGLGVILDWVPSHFPHDLHGLAFFDGTHLFEHADPKQGFHPEWNSHIFNYGRNEVQSILISSALFWLDAYHADGLRVDAVASMLHLDYARKTGEWIPNEHGGNENLDAIRFLRRLNEAAYAAENADIQTIAEESTAWPMVSRPVHLGGLGFGMKWNMGWMNDTLSYFSRDPVHRKYAHNQLLFSMWYAYSENFMLPLSHDEVVHGKSSLIGKMPGDEWQKFANLRLLLGYLFAHPGKKLQFMGAELGQWSEWRHDTSLDWHLLDYPLHRGVQAWVRDLNRVYRSEEALHELDFSREGFEWNDFSDSEQSVISFVRRARSGDLILAVFNFTPVPRPGYTIRAPRGGWWSEVLNSDSEYYGGSGRGNAGGVHATPGVFPGAGWSITLDLPPLGVVWLKSPAGRGGSAGSGSATGS